MTVLTPLVVLCPTWLRLKGPLIPSASTDTLLAPVDRSVSSARWSISGILLQRTRSRLAPGSPLKVIPIVRLAFNRLARLIYVKPQVSTVLPIRVLLKLQIMTALPIARRR